MTIIARLYYEMHVTVSAPEDPTGELWEDFKKAVALYGWRPSKFDEDLVDNYSGKWFLSARDTVKENCKSSLRIILAALAYAGLEVVRWKIEDTILDSKYGDKL